MAKITRAWDLEFSNPAAGDVQFIEVPYAVGIDKISSYCVGATSVTFNVEKRTAPGTSGSDLLASDQVATVAGASSTSITDNPIAAGTFLCVSIASVSGTPTKFSVTVRYSYEELDAPAALSTAGAIGAVVLTQAHTLAGVDTLATASSVQGPIEVLTPGVLNINNLVTAGSLGAVVLSGGSGSSTLTKVYDILLKNPAIGGIPLIEIPKGQIVTRIEAYAPAGSTVTLNIEERMTPGVAGEDVLAADLVADADGQVSTSFSNSGLAAGNFLYADISATSGSPAWVAISIRYTQTETIEATLAPANLVTASGLGAPVLVTSYQLSPAALFTASAIGGAALSQAQMLHGVTNLQTDGTLGEPIMAMVRYVDFMLGVSHLLVVADMGTAGAIASPTLSVGTEMRLSVEDLETDGSIGAAALTQEHRLGPQDVLTRSQIGITDLTQEQVLVAAGLVTGSLLDALTLSSQNHWLVPADLLTAGSLGSPILQTLGAVVKPHYARPAPRETISQVHRRRA